MEDHTTISSDCRTIHVRKSIWNGKEQKPKTENAIRSGRYSNNSCGILEIVRRKSFLRLSVSDRERSAARTKQHPQGLDPLLRGRRLSLLSTIPNVSPSQEPSTLGLGKVLDRPMRTRTLRTSILSNRRMKWNTDANGPTKSGLVLLCPVCPNRAHFQLNSTWRNLLKLEEIAIAIPR